MTLRSTFRELYATAEARQAEGRPGEAYKALRQGATVKVRVLGRRRQVILGRRGAPVGEVEIVTFRRDGDIPQAAERNDYADDKGWHYVALRWERQQAALPELDLPPSL